MQRWFPLTPHPWWQQHLENPPGPGGRGFAAPKDTATAWGGCLVAQGGRSASWSWLRAPFQASFCLLEAAGNVLCSLFFQCSIAMIWRYFAPEEAELPAPVCSTKGSPPGSPPARCPLQPCPVCFISQGVKGDVGTHQ